MATFQPGDRVRVRDDLDFSATTRFGYGIVTSVDENGPFVCPDGWDIPVRFEEVQHLAPGDPLMSAASASQKTPSFARKGPNMDIYYTSSGPTKELTTTTNAFEGYAPYADGHTHVLEHAPEWRVYLKMSMIHPQPTTNNKGTTRAAQMGNGLDAVPGLWAAHMDYGQAMDYGGCLGKRRHEDWSARYEERIHHDGFFPEMRMDSIELDPFNAKDLFEMINNSTIM